jgi:hypothetical protein
MPIGIDNSAPNRHQPTADRLRGARGVLSTLIGIAIADGLIADIDHPLSTLLPKASQGIGDTAKIALRNQMTMSGGFNNQFPEKAGTCLILSMCPKLSVGSDLRVGRGVPKTSGPSSLAVLPRLFLRFVSLRLWLYREVEPLEKCPLQPANNQIDVRRGPLSEDPRGVDEIMQRPSLLELLAPRRASNPI